MTQSAIARNDEGGDEHRQFTPGVTMSDRPSSASAILPGSARVAPVVTMGGDALDLATSKTAREAAAGVYPGGKNGAGVFQRLISLMPPHDVYVEAFLGSGAIIRRKRPASADNVGIDADACVIAAHGAGGHRSYRVLHADARLWLRRHRFQPGTLVYADPPYLGSSRCRSGRALYRVELMGADEHAELLQILMSIPAMVMISGYPSALYDDALKGWSRVEYNAQTRGGVKREVAWMNYAPPTELHDYSFLGEDFHDRCRIARKIKRHCARLAALPALERAAVIAGIVGAAGGAR